MGLIPFIAGDVVKIIVMAGIVRGIAPKRAYNNEVNKIHINVIVHRK